MPHPDIRTDGKGDSDDNRQDQASDEGPLDSEDSKETEIVLEPAEEEQYYQYETYQSPYGEAVEFDEIHYADEGENEVPQNEEANKEHDHIIVSNPRRIETLEEMQERINQEIRVQRAGTTPPLIANVDHEDLVENGECEEDCDDEDGDLVIDEQPKPTPKESDSSAFSVPKSPKASTPKKVEDGSGEGKEKRYPSGPYIETDSDATPTKPKHVRMSTSSEDSVFLPVRKQVENSKSAVEELRPEVLSQQREEEEYDGSEEEMDSDFDDMPDLEETPEMTDSFIDDLPMLEEIHPLPPKPPRKRKSLPTAPPPTMSPVKRHRRGIRRTKSAAESYVQNRIK